MNIPKRWKSRTGFTLPTFSQEWRKQKREKSGVFTLPSFSQKSQTGFTLIELLVVIAIIAVLMVAVVITLNPTELLKQSRDSNRLSDLESIQTAMQLYLTDISPASLGTASTSYLSLYDPTVGTTGGSCSSVTGTTHCAASSTYRKSDSTGWIPVDMTKISIGSPLPTLPVDPINTAVSGLYYTYMTDGTNWEVSANAESQKFKAQFPQSPQFTVGTSMSLIAATSTSLASYTLTYTAGPNGTLTGSSPQTVAYGGNGTSVTAVPNTGISFVNWSDGSTANPRTDTDVTGNISVTANFSNPVPTLTSITPTSTAEENPQFTLTVNGSNFITSSTVDWNGSSLATTYLSSAQLTATVPATDIASAGTSTVTVVTPTPGGGTSSGATFTTIASFACGTSTVAGLSPDTTVYHTVLGADGNCWLASNLGTANIAATTTDSSAYGWLYQWGRLTDGHQVPTSATTTTLSTTDVPGNADFIEAPNTPYDWRSGQNNNLWQGTSTAINNPCPSGWSIPTDAQWTTWATDVDPSYASCSSGCDTAMYNTTLKLTDAGYRNYSSAALNLQGTYGYYWSSSVDGTHAYNLNFYSGGVGPANNGYRAYGFSARCLKD